MSRMLRWVAAWGLGIGTVSLVLAYALGGHDVPRMFDRGLFAARDCKDGSASSERRLAWSGGTSIDIALPAAAARDRARRRRVAAPALTETARPHPPRPSHEPPVTCATPTDSPPPPPPPPPPLPSRITEPQAPRRRDLMVPGESVAIWPVR